MSNMRWHSFEHSLLGRTKLWLKKKPRKEQKTMWKSDGLVVTLSPIVALKPPIAFLSIQVTISIGTYDNSFCLCLLVFAEYYTSKPKYRHSRLFIVIPRASRLCFCQNILTSSRHLYSIHRTVAGKCSRYPTL